MPMNKHPERTVEKILKVAEKLFVAKGYHDTSMQDIIDGLHPDLTKGAIYYHFKSRDDIFYRIVADKCIAIYNDLDAIIARDDLNGKEKFNMALDMGNAGREQDALMAFFNAVNTKDGKAKAVMAAYGIKFAEIEIIPRFKVMLREGTKDGSIMCLYPNEMAELLSYLTTVWLSSKMGIVSQKVYLRKLMFIDSLFSRYGINVVDEAKRELYSSIIASAE